jgi:hypothetical protein
LDPKEPRSRSPSLLDGDVSEAVSPAPSGRILSGIGGDTPPAPVTHRPRRWLWPSLIILLCGAAACLLVFGGAFDDSAQAPDTRMAASRDASHARAADPVGSAVAADVSPEQGDSLAMQAAPDAAVILPGSAAPADTGSAVAPAAATSANSDAVALGEMFAPAAERKRVTTPRRSVKRPPPTGDSDVALLTALIQHVEVGTPTSRKALERIPHVRKPVGALDDIEARMQACPAANTEAGLRCRKKLCAGHSGQTSACPASTSGGA